MALFGKSEREKRQEDYQDWHEAREHAKANAEQNLMWSKRREEARKEKHDALSADLSELKEEFNKAKEIEKVQDKLGAIIAIYSQTQTIIKQAHKVGDYSIPDLVKAFQARMADTIAFIAKPKNRDEQMECLHLLTTKKIESKKINNWKKELAKQVRVQHPEDPELLMYCDKVLGRVVPANASMSTKLKIVSGNLLKKIFGL